MPVIAVAAAIGSIAVAGSAVAATGIAAMSAIAAFEVVAAVGATIGAIGVVTKDKTLSMVGLAIGAVGGIGALASSAGLFGAEAASGASLFGSEAAASAAVDTVAGATPEASGIAGGLASASDGIPGGLENAASAAADPASANTYNFIAGPPEGKADIMSFGTQNTTDPMLDQAMGKLTPAERAAVDKIHDMSGLNPGQYNALPDVTGGITPPTPPGTAPGAGDIAAWQMPGKWVGGVNDAFGKFDISGGGVFGQILDFANNNKLVSSGIIQGGGALLSGLTSTETPAKVSAYNAQAASSYAQAASNQAQADMLNQQRANLAMPKAVVSSAPVTGTPSAILPGRTGFINQAMGSRA